MISPKFVKSTSFWLSAFFAWFILAGCGQKEPAGSAKSIKAPVVSVHVVEKAVISRSIQLTGTVEPVRLARFASPAEGPVTGLLVREGDHVRQDQLLLTIGRSSGAEANLEAAQIALDREREELRRVKQLVESGALPAEQLDIALVREANALANYNRSRELSGDFQIRAPMDGLVAKVYVTEGDYVTPRLHLLDVYDPASLVLRFAVPEASALLLKKGLIVEVYLDAFPGRKDQARVSRVYPDLDRTLRTRTAEAVLTEKVDLAPGMFARLNLILESHTDVVIVPPEALLATPSGDRILFVVEEGKAAQKKVEIGIETESAVEILSGIQEGDSVIIAGNEKLKSGTPVNVMKAGKK
jgi:membrane fusion protein (multidrug efflux system)